MEGSSGTVGSTEGSTLAVVEVTNYGLEMYENGFAHRDEGGQFVPGIIELEHLRSRREGRLGSSLLHSRPGSGTAWRSVLAALIDPHETLDLNITTRSHLTRGQMTGSRHCIVEHEESEGKDAESDEEEWPKTTGDPREGDMV